MASVFSNVVGVTVCGMKSHSRGAMETSSRKNRTGKVKSDEVVTNPPTATNESADSFASANFKFRNSSLGQSLQFTLHTPGEAPKISFYKIKIVNAKFGDEAQRKGKSNMRYGNQRDCHFKGSIDGKRK